MSGIDIEKYEGEVELEVLVQFNTARNTVVEGSYYGTFGRPSQDELDDVLDDDNGFSQADVVRKYLRKVRGIAKGKEEMPADEQLSWVLNTPECVNAGFAAFFKAFRPERYVEKTSRKRRSRG